MLFRKLKLNWRYAVGELLIVVAGVLIALAIDQWNSDRLDREEEREIIARLLDELTFDRVVYDFVLDRVDRKQGCLARLKETFAAGFTENPRAVLDDLVCAADFGWNQSVASSVTYNELKNAGRLQLIRSSQLRASIAFYYESVADEIRRSDERETRFPAVSYTLAPRETPPEHDKPFQVEEVRADPSLTDEEAIALATRALGSDVGDLLIAEANFGQFVFALTGGFAKAAEDLIEELRQYQEEIR
jgi:hypothetical protein